MTADPRVAELVEEMWAARQAAAVLGFTSLGRPIPDALRERAAKLRASGHITDAGITDRGHYLWGLLIDENIDPVDHAKYIKWDPNMEIIYPFQEQA